MWEHVSVLAGQAVACLSAKSHQSDGHVARRSSGFGDGFENLLWERELGKQVG
jgi:hypothetical protein